MKRDLMKQVPSEAEKHHFIGNELCLDFANTLYGHVGTPLHEYLYGYRDLVLWSRRAGILEASEAETLIRISERHANEALAVFQRAIALREIIFRVFDAIARRASPRGEDVTALDRARSNALAHSHIQKRSAGFATDWDDKTAFDRILWPIAISAGNLLTSDRVGRVRECSGTTCDWLFLDTSRNHMRRWCSMSVCGNRAKVHRFLQRRRRLAV